MLSYWRFPARGIILHINTIHCTNLPINTLHYPNLLTSATSLDALRFQIGSAQTVKRKFLIGSFLVLIVATKNSTETLMQYIG
jgi:hypothetical protein